LYSDIADGGAREIKKYANKIYVEELEVLHSPLRIMAAKTPQSTLTSPHLTIDQQHFVARFYRAQFQKHYAAPRRALKARQAAE
jgi:hypothetical protein